MDDCWASAISSCRGGLSNEHIDARSWHTAQKVEVGGWPGTSGVIPMDLDSYAVASLCRRHNNELSRVDEQSGDAIRAIRDFGVQAARRRSKLPAAPPPATYRVAGRPFERAAFKIAMNLARVQHETFAGWRPPNWVPHVVFGLLDPIPPLGLHMTSGLDDWRDFESPEQLDSTRDPIGFAFGMHDGEPAFMKLVLGIGWRFVVNWSPHLVFSDAIRPARLEHEDGSAVVFDWSANAETSIEVLRLRTDPLHVGARAPRVKTKKPKRRKPKKPRSRYGRNK